MPDASGWSAHELTFRWPGASRPAVRDVTLGVAGRGCTALLGPNGAGKSTLLRLLLGTLEPDAGHVEFAGRPLPEWTRAELAKRVGVLPQGEETAFPMTVRDCVAMGRYPHLGPWRREGPDDLAAIEQAMRQADVLELADRPLQGISGGERQRARLARSLAQEPDAFALDEPTAALDVRHEMAIFELLRGLGARGSTVLLVTHNINLAARYADTLVLLHEGRIAAAGTPVEVLRRELLESVYGWPMDVVPLAGHGPDAGTPQVVPLSTSRSNRASPDSIQE